MSPLVVLLTIHAPADFDTAEMVAAAQRVYDSAKIELVVSRTKTLAVREINSVRERNALSREVPRDGSVHVFVVDRLADKAREDVVIGGVHWYHRGRRYLIVSRLDGRHDTFAHELGHFLGLRHTRARDNIMSPPDRIHDASLTSSQRRRVRKTLDSRLD